MIHYDLRCGDGHVFAAWFRDSAGFESQAAEGAIACPVCEDRTIQRAPMAPSVARKGNAAEAIPPEIAMKHMLRALRQAVEAHCEPVGDRFAEEARKIHYGEAAPRGIYGDATVEEALALEEEGIAVGVVPWLPEADA